MALASFSRWARARSATQSDAPDSEFFPVQGPEPEVGNERPLGEILRSVGKLNSEQTLRVVEHQGRHGVRFGDAAIALGFVSRDDVLWGLAQQFRYPYASGASRTHGGELFMADEPFGDRVEPFRDLRTHLLSTVMPLEGIAAPLAVVSADVGDGKTFLAANLAVAFCQLPGRTVIVDCDLRTPRLHDVFGQKQSPGLSDLLSGRAKPKFLSPVKSLPNLYFMPSGTLPPNPLELLQHPNFAMLLRRMSRKFNYVLIDTPAGAHGSDARTIAALTGTALFVTRRNRTRAQPAQRLMAQLNRSSVGIAGVVMNEG